MDVLQTVLTTIDLLSKWAPVIEKGISDLMPFAESLYNKLSGGKAMTDAERQVLRDKLEALHNEFQSPMPPEPQD